MTAPNPFALLGVPPTATHAEIKIAYRGLVRLYHPDNNPGFPTEAAAKLRELRDAYDAALAGWTPGLAGTTGAPGSSGVGQGPVAPRPATRASAGRRGRRVRRAGQTYERPWQAPPPNKHDNPPRKMDPPKVPPKQQGPEPPQPKYAHVPPPRAASARRDDRPVDVLEQSRRRDALIGDLVEIGFVGHPDEIALDHAIVDAFVPVLADGDRVRVAARYDALAAAGTPAAVRHHEVFLHAVPTSSGDDARAKAIAALVRAQLVAVTGDRLLWTVSRFAEADGLLLQERVDVHAESLDSINRASLMQGGVGIGFSAGLAVRFSLATDAATGLVAAVGQSSGGSAAAR